MERVPSDDSDETERDEIADPIAQGGAAKNQHRADAPREGPDRNRPFRRNACDDPVVEHGSLCGSPPLGYSRVIEHLQNLQ